MDFRINPMGEPSTERDPETQDLLDRATRIAFARLNQDSEQGVDTPQHFSIDMRDESFHEGSPISAGLTGPLAPPSERGNMGKADLAGEVAATQLASVANPNAYRPSTQVLRDARESWAQDRSLVQDGLAAGVDAINTGIGQHNAPNIYAGRGKQIRDEVQSQNEAEVTQYQSASRLAHDVIDRQRNTEVTEKKDEREEVKFEREMHALDKEEHTEMERNDPNSSASNRLRTLQRQVYSLVPPETFEGLSYAELKDDEPYIANLNQQEAAKRAAAAQARAAAGKQRLEAMNRQDRYAVALDHLGKSRPELLDDPELLNSMARQLAENEKEFAKIIDVKAAGSGPGITVAGRTYAFTGEKEDPTTRREVAAKVSGANKADRALAQLEKLAKDYNVLSEAADVTGRSNVKDSWPDAKERAIKNILEARGQNYDRDIDARKKLEAQLGELDSFAKAVGLKSVTGPAQAIRRELWNEVDSDAQAQGYTPPPKRSAAGTAQGQRTGATGSWGDSAETQLAEPKRRAASVRKTSRIVHDKKTGKRKVVPTSELAPYESDPNFHVFSERY